jgi:hypothetical protein
MVVRNGRSLRAAYLFNVVVWDEALGLVRLAILVLEPLLLRLPPVVVGRLLQHHEHITLIEGELVVALRRVVIDGAVDAEEHHRGGGGYGVLGVEARRWCGAAMLCISSAADGFEGLAGERC